MRRLLCTLILVSACALFWGCDSKSIDELNVPTGQQANQGGGNNPNPPQPCNGTVVNNINAVPNPNDNTQGFALEYTDVNNTNADTNNATAANPGGTANGGSNGAVTAILSVVDVTGVKTININMLNAAGGFQQGDVVPVIPVGAAPPPGNTMFATVVIAQQGAGGGQDQWFGAGGNLVIDLLVAPTNQNPGQLTATLQGLCFTPNGATGATGTFTINGQYFHNLVFTGP